MRFEPPGLAVESVESLVLITINIKRGEETVNYY